MGASLGGLAMLHAQRRFPRTFGALFLQSGSFFMPRYDAHESRLPPLRPRSSRFVRETLRDGQYAIPVPVDAHLRRRGGERPQQSRDGACPGRQGYDVRWTRSPTLHNYAAWRDAFDPHLTRAAARDAW